MRFFNQFLTFIFLTWIFFTPWQTAHADKESSLADRNALKAAIDKRASKEKEQYPDSVSPPLTLYNYLGDKIVVPLKPGEYMWKAAQDYQKAHPEIYIDPQGDGRIAPWVEPHISALPPQINDALVYTQTFADRFGLDDNSVLPLDPALGAVQVRFHLVYEFNYNPKDPFVQRYHLDQLTSAQREALSYHLNALPIFFRGEKMPLKAHYDCDLDLFLNKTDPRVKDIQMPTRSIWWDAQVNDRAIYDMLMPIQENQITAPQEPGLQQAAHHQPKQLIANYQAYLTQVLNGPQAVLGSNKSALDNLPSNQNQRTLLSYNSHVTDFLPGLTYLSFHIPYCRVLGENNPPAGTWLWVQKKDSQIKYDADHFYAFALPAAISQLPEIKTVQAFNENPPAILWYSPMDLKKMYFWKQPW